MSSQPERIPEQLKEKTCTALTEYLPPIEPPQQERSGDPLAADRLAHALRCYRKAAQTDAGRLFGIA